MAMLIDRDGPDFEDQRSLREWWHSIIRRHSHRYQCYMFYLVLPSDKEAIQYLQNYGDELHLISGTECLIVVINSSWVGTEDLKWEKGDEAFLEKAWSTLRAYWSRAVLNYVPSDFSVKVARHFNIPFTELPCIVAFEDIRSSQHMVISLKNMDEEEISERLREVFSVIADSDKKPLTAMQAHQNSERFRRAGSSILSELRVITGNTFETAMEALIKANIK